MGGGGAAGPYRGGRVDRVVRPAARPCALRGQPGANLGPAVLHSGIVGAALTCTSTASPSASGCRCTRQRSRTGRPWTSWSRASWSCCSTHRHPPCSRSTSRTTPADRLREPLSLGVVGLAAASRRVSAPVEQTDVPSLLRAVPLRWPWCAARNDLRPVGLGKCQDDQREPCSGPCNGLPVRLGAIGSMAPARGATGRPGPQVGRHRPRRVSARCEASGERAQRACAAEAPIG